MFRLFNAKSEWTFAVFVEWMVFQVSERHVNRNLDPADASGFEKKEEGELCCHVNFIQFYGNIVIPTSFVWFEHCDVCFIGEAHISAHPIQTFNKHTHQVNWFSFRFSPAEEKYFFSLCSVDCLQNYNQTQRLANEMNGPSWKSIHSITNRNLRWVSKNHRRTIETDFSLFKNLL